MALFELTELASYLQQDLDTASAEQARTRATNYLRTELGVEFTEASRTLTARVSALATYQRLIGPLVSVASVEVDGVALTVLTDYEVTRRGIVCPRGFGSWSLTAASWSGVTSPSWVSLEVTYTAGFADPLPADNADLKDAAIQLAGLSYLRSAKPGLKSSSTQIDDYTLTEAYVADSTTSAPMALDDATLRSLKARYGSGRPTAASVLLR